MFSASLLMRRPFFGKISICAEAALRGHTQSSELSQPLSFRDVHSVTVISSGKTWLPLAREDFHMQKEKFIVA
jgi:hypothetical protein